MTKLLLASLKEFHLHAGPTRAHTHILIPLLPPTHIYTHSRRLDSDWFYHIFVSLLHKIVSITPSRCCWQNNVLTIHSSPKKSVWVIVAVKVHLSVFLAQVSEQGIQLVFIHITVHVLEIKRKEGYVRHSKNVLSCQFVATLS